MIYYFWFYTRTLTGKLNPNLKANLNEQPSICPNNFSHKSVSTFVTCRNFIWMKNWIYTIFSEKFRNQYKEQTNIAKYLLTFSHYYNGGMLGDTLLY